MNDLVNNIVSHGDELVIEDCDCHRCALEFRNRYKRALASIREEVGLPPTMRPALGELKSLIEAGKRALAAINDATKAVSKSADFERMTWTLGIIEGGRAGAGVYALVWLGENVSDAP